MYGNVNSKLIFYVSVDDTFYDSLYEANNFPTSAFLKYTKYILYQITLKTFIILYNGTFSQLNNFK